MDKTIRKSRFAQPSPGLVAGLGAGILLARPADLQRSEIQGEIERSLRALL